MTNNEHSLPPRDRIGMVLTRKASVAAEVSIALLILSLSLFSGATTYLILLFGWLSLWLRRATWKQLGMSKPSNWPGTAALGLLVGVAWSLLDVFVTSPLITSLTRQPLDYSLFQGIQGNLPSYLIMLAIVWTIVPFGEEMVYRGYLLNRMSDFFGRSRYGWSISVVVVSVCFGFAHSYQDISGIILTGYVAFVMGLLYFVAGKNLWLPITVHAVYDTVGITLFFFGLDPALGN